MEEKYGVRLENIVYYKDETHYFVMTALKNSLLKLKVLKEVGFSFINYFCFFYSMEFGLNSI